MSFFENCIKEVDADTHEERVSLPLQDFELIRAISEGKGDAIFQCNILITELEVSNKAYAIKQKELETTIKELRNAKASRKVSELQSEIEKYKEENVYIEQLYQEYDRDHVITH